MRSSHQLDYHIFDINPFIIKPNFGVRTDKLFVKMTLIVPQFAELITLLKFVFLFF